MQPVYREDKRGATANVLRRDTGDVTKPLPPPPGLRPPSRAAFPGRREGYRGLGGGSDESIEIFLLQRN